MLFFFFFCGLKIYFSNEVDVKQLGYVRSIEGVSAGVCVCVIPLCQMSYLPPYSGRDLRRGCCWCWCRLSPLLHAHTRTHTHTHTHTRASPHTRGRSAVILMVWMGLAASPYKPRAHTHTHTHSHEGCLQVNYPPKGGLPLSRLAVLRVQ